MQEGSSREAGGRAEKSQFAGFGVAPERDALRAVPAHFQLDQASVPAPHLASQAASESPSPVGRKQVCHTETLVYSSNAKQLCWRQCTKAMLNECASSSLKQQCWAMMSATAYSSNAEGLCWIWSQQQCWTTDILLQVLACCTDFAQPPHLPLTAVPALGQSASPPAKCFTIHACVFDARLAHC